MGDPIMWQNADHTVTLIDIPRSIACAQGHSMASSMALLSTLPLDAPYPSNEPKSETAKAKLKGNNAEYELHVEYGHILQKAIEEVKSGHPGDCCLPRECVEPSPRPAKKRRLDYTGSYSAPTDELDLPKNFLSNMARSRQPAEEDITIIWPAETELPYAVEQSEASDPGSEGLTMCNPHRQTATLKLQTESSAEPFTFYIPPKASFYLRDCTESKNLRNAVRQTAREQSTRSAFDFIIFDPPWPNRSVKRTHKTPGSTYATSPSLEQLRDMMLDMKLDILVEDGGLVSIWITNKPAIRDFVLGDRGIFNCCNIELIEEWIWLKTTSKGEPVTQIDGLWRKPYEVLLVGRKKKKDEKLLGQQHLAQNIKRRVIIGVPDLHSRKPCLKSLIEPMMRDSVNYRALEVFARYLVAGWWSWGDECIKYNWEGYWRQIEEG